MGKMKHIVETLNHAADVYYNKGTELMSNKEFQQPTTKVVGLRSPSGQNNHVE